MLKKFTKTVKQTTKKVKEIGTKLIHGRNDLGPNVKKLLKQYGDVPIVGLTIFRHALASPLVSAIDAVSGFQFKKNIENSPYDELFHLGMKITLQGNTIFNLEKTEVISLTMNPTADPTDEFLVVSDVPENLTLNKMLENCKAKMGPNFYTYASASNNCQDFCLACLQSNFMNSPEIIDFVKQNTLELFENTGVLNKVANTLTDFAGRMDVLRRGGNMHHNRKLAVLHHRHENDFNKATKKIFNLMSVSGKYRVVGSAQISNLMYNSDYDLNEFVGEKDGNTFKHIYSLFREKFIKAKKDKQTWIVDFKCGVDKKGEAVKWNYADVMKGMKVVQGEEMSFEDAIKSRGKIKMDVIALVSGKFLEFSDIYYLRIEGKKYYGDMDKASAKRELKESAEEEKREGNHMKYLKRKFSLAVLDDKKKVMEELIEYFNGPVGFINKQLSDLKIIDMILGQKFRKVDINIVVANLQAIKQNLSFYSGLPLPDQLSSDLDLICDASTKAKRKRAMIKHIIDNLQIIINENSLQFIKSHNIL